MGNPVNCQSKIPYYHFNHLLRMCTWSDLRAIAFTHHRTFDSHYTKTQAAAYVHGWLAASQYLTQILEKLPNAAYEALLVLKTCQGMMRTSKFVQHYGDIHKYKPWCKERQIPPWQHSPSVTNKLWYLGLIFETKVDRDGSNYITIPFELAEILTIKNPTPPPHFTSSNWGSPTITLDITHLLTYLQWHSVKPLHYRWLSPKHYRAINASFYHMDINATEARSELQTTYFRFVHYLAEAAEMVGITMGYLKPTIFAWEWLGASEPDRHRTLFTSWIKNPELWQLYRQPGHADFAQVVIDVLSQNAEAHWDQDSLLRMIKARSIAEGAIEHIDDFSAEVTALLTGPIMWSGWGEIRAGGEFRLTALGQWLVNDKVPVPSVPSEQGLSLVECREDEIVFRMPNTSILQPLQLFVELGLTVQENDSQFYSYSIQHYAQMRSNGLSLPTIAAKLQTITKGTLPREVLQLLNRWEASLQICQLESEILLKVKEPEILSNLMNDLTLRNYFETRISPRYASVKPSMINNLIKVLSQRGLLPISGCKFGARPVNVQEPHYAEEYILDGTIDPLYLALSLISLLGDIIDVPYNPSSDVRNHLASLLTPDKVAYLDALANDTLMKIRDGMDGYTIYPAILPETDLNLIRQTLDQAIEKQQSVEIIYHTAGRGERTTRIVEPHWIENHNGVLYLIGYCQLRQEERRFRLDRIESITHLA